MLTLQKTRKYDPQSATKLSPAQIAVLFKTLMSSSKTTEELMEMNITHEKRLKRALYLYHEEGLIYVSGWDTDSLGRFTIPRWSFGVEVDVPRPVVQEVVQRRKATAARCQRNRLARRKLAEDMILQNPELAKQFAENNAAMMQAA